MNTRNETVNTELTPRQRARRKRRRILISLSSFALALLVGASQITSGAFGLLPQSGVAEGSDYQVASLTTGTLKQTVTGSGSIEMNDTVTVTVPAGLTIESLNVEAGESVNAGDALVTLNKKSVQSKLEELTEELATLNTELAALSGDTTSSSITATVKGRVKVIYGQAGQDVQGVMEQYGALMLLSVDGYMKVELDVSGQNVSLNQDVVVVLPSGTSLSGYIYSISDSGVARVLVSDKTLAQGESVTVKDEDGNVLGTGTAEINNPLRITGTAGTIKSLSVSVNSAVSKGSTLMTLKNLPISDDYAVKLAEREDCLDEITRMKGYLTDPVVRSDKTGIVNTLDLSAGLTLEEDSRIVLTTRDNITLKVSVDELDILKLQSGMQAEVTVDAISGETFTGTVSKISASGTTSNNVTTYPVKVQLSDDSRFLPGMSASASVTVRESQNALLVPVSALNTARGETFVYVYSELQTLSATDEPGVRTVITTGLSNDEYAEVLSGLSPSDQVVVTKAAATSSSSMSQQQGGMMMDMGMMSGGTPPSGAPSDRTGGRPSN